MQQVTSLVFFYNDLRLKNLFDWNSTEEIDELGTFYTIIDKPEEKFLLFSNSLLTDPSYTTKDFFHKILSIAKTKKYRIVLYDNYEVMNLEKFENPYDNNFSIHDISKLAEEINFDKGQIYIYDCGDKSYYKKQHHLKPINFIKYNNVVREHTKFKCASPNILMKHPNEFPTLNPELKTRWFCSFTNKMKPHRVIFHSLMCQNPLWKSQHISFNNINQELDLKPEQSHYLQNIKENKLTAPHEPVFDHFTHSFYIGPSVKTFQQSAICVVGESQFFPNNIFITEKTTNPIVNCLPVIVYGQKHHMHTLEELGIDIFRDLFGDFAYDNIADMEKRVIACSDLCKKFLNKDISYYQDWLKDNKERLLSNARLLIRQVEKQGDKIEKYNDHFMKGMDPNFQTMI